MTKKNILKIALAFLILLTFTSSYGQREKEDKHKRDSTKYWEFGTDLLWLINKNQLPPINLQVKKHLTENSALRLRIGINMSSKDSTKTFGDSISASGAHTPIPYPGPPDKNNSFTAFIRAG